MFKKYAYPLEDFKDSNEFSAEDYLESEHKKNIEEIRQMAK